MRDMGLWLIHAIFSLSILIIKNMTQSTQIHINQLVNNIAHFQIDP